MDFQHYFPSQSNSWKLLIFTVGVRILLLLLVLVLFITMKSILSQWFIFSNPFFTLRTIQIKTPTGSYTEEKIHSIIPLDVGKENLFTIDIESLRQGIIKYTSAREVEVRRILPDTLDIIVYGRVVVAQLLRPGGRLIDAEGVVLHPSIKEETRFLPIITGIAGFSAYSIGEKIINPMVTKIVQLLERKSTIEHEDSLDFYLVQLDENFRQYRVYLKKNKNYLIRRNALLILPFSPDFSAMQKALERTIQIVEQRQNESLVTGYIDASYKKRVPVLP